MEALYTAFFGKRGLRGHLRFFGHIGVSLLIVIASSLVTIATTIAQSAGYRGAVVKIVESISYWGWIAGASLFLYALIAGSIMAFFRIEAEEKELEADAPQRKDRS